MTEKIYDVIVVGAGPAGLTAALYASRSGLDTLLLEKGISGGQLLNTDVVENYTGSGAIKGPDLAEKMEEDAFKFGAENAFGSVSKIEIDNENNLRLVHTRNKVYKTKSIIISTGTTNRKLGIPGEQEFAGRGVSYCAVCDGAFFKNKELVVVGGGDSAVEEGLYLTQFAEKVTLVHRRDTLRAQKILQDRFFAHPKTDIIWDSNVISVNGENMVNSVSVANKHDNSISEIPVSGAFIYVGLLPNTNEFLDLGITNDEGFIMTDQLMKTKIKGIYAVGDVRDTPLRQVATAVSDGAIAGNEVFKYIQEEF